MAEQPQDYYSDFVALTDRLYPHCTLTEKLRVYVQHKPGCVVPFLEQLIRALHPDENPRPARAPARGGDRIMSDAIYTPRCPICGSHIPEDGSFVTGAERITHERVTQIAKGYDTAHDAEHDGGEIAFAALMLLANYLNGLAEERATELVVVCVGADEVFEDQWGLAKKHKDPVRRLEIVGALIAAEIDRIARIRGEETGA